MPHPIPLLDDDLLAPPSAAELLVAFVVALGLGAAVFAVVALAMA